MKKRRNMILPAIFCLCLAVLMCRGTTAELRLAMCVACLFIFALYFTQTLIHERDTIFIDCDDENNEI